MKIGIMQPYFLPYFGYFQLIYATDKYVNLDHVNFMKRSFMTRNTLRDDIQINVNVTGGSQNKSCRDVMVNFENDYIPKFLKTLKQNYSKSLNYEEIIQQIISPEFVERDVSISDFNLGLIKRICSFLDITTEIIDSSSAFDNSSLKKQAGLVDIVHQLKGDVYINAIGGQALYKKEDFKAHGIDLFFMNMGQLSFKNSNASILDLLFTYNRSTILEQLSNYTLI